ncbi:MAG TPA: DUF2141 domain-containing protein [Myxococcaceae bacterium]|nr:DUF2141 domain-containing protein [Myxococcaceae bacterium]
MVIRLVPALTLVLLGPLASARAAELVVKVTGVASDAGEIGCALYAGPEGFPLDRARAVAGQWQPAKQGVVECRFPGLKRGVYAVAVSHDLNGNRRTDTNFLGMPTEDWGVSNNVRPSLRPPTFDEAQVGVGERDVEIQIKVAR